MAKRTCITCKAKGIDKDKTPLWSKKDGLYSMLPRILNCEDKYNPHKTELEESTPEIVGTEVTFEIELEEKNNWVFYWAAEAGAALEGDKPEGAAKSYGDESNHGLSKLDADGKATLTLNCPKLYMEDGKLFPRHVHYTILTKDKVWSTNIGTYEITCNIPFETMKEIQEKRTYMIMNALSQEEFDENHIPNSILCHHESLDGLGKQKKTGIIKKLIKENLSSYPPAKKFVNDVDDIKQIPIVVYCASEECNASEKLKEHLYSAGFFNVLEYPGGIKEWLKKSNKTSLFEDAESEEEDVEEENLDKDLEQDMDEEDTDISDEDEIYIYEGIPYIHKLDGSDEVLNQHDLNIVGILVDDDIEWINSTEYEKHTRRKSDKGALKIDDEDDDEADDDDDDEEDENDDEEKEEDENEEDDDEADEDDEDDDEEAVDQETSDEEDDEGDEEESGMNESLLQSKGVSELKKLLDKYKDMVKKNPKKKKDMINCLLGCKTKYMGGGYEDSIIYGGRINQTMYDNSFRGWGFTFNM